MRWLRIAAAIVSSTAGARVTLVGGEIAGAVALVVAALVTGVFAWRTARRLNSGTVEVSPAAELWKASNDLRKDLRDEAVRLADRCKELQGEVGKLSERVAVVEDREAECRTENAALRTRVDELTDALASLRGGRG